MSTISQLARETLVFVPLGLPFFIPFAFANRTGWSFWPWFVASLTLASITIGIWPLLTSSDRAEELDSPSEVETRDEN